MKVHLSGLDVAPDAAAGMLAIPPTDGVILHPSTHDVVELDRTGATFWRALRATESVEQAVALLGSQFNVTQERISADMAAFIEQLDRQGLVAHCPPIPHEPHVASQLRVTAILAAHNRREATVACLQALFACVPPHCHLTAVLVDDGSTDGTAAAVAELDLPVTLVAGTGTWYWSRSMAEAEKVAEHGDPDLIVWLNDDVTLDPTALARALHTHRDHPDALLVGAMWSPQRGDVSFTGMRYAGQGPREGTRRLAPTATPQPIDQFHGNFVLVPRQVRATIGPIDGTWPHHYADLDYAARARELGVPMLLLPGLMGVCEPHIAAWHNPDEPWAARVRALFGRKGWPLTAQLRFQRRHGDQVDWPGEIGRYLAALTGDSARQPPRPRLLQITPPHNRGHETTRQQPANAHDPAHAEQPTPRWPVTPTADLIRLGPPRDGGYVVNRSAVMAAEHLLTGGLGDDWAFEEAFREENAVPVSVYDGTMGGTFWLKYTWDAAGRFFRRPSITQATQVGRYLGYRRFFGHPGVRHLPRNLTATGSGAASLLQAMDTVTAHNLFVKLDIEGGEYALFGALLAHADRLTGVVMEVHNVPAHAKRISDFIARFDTHALTFVRANNAGGVDSHGVPRLLEMTWTRRDLLNAGESDLSQLEYQNVEGLPKMHWQA